MDPITLGTAVVSAFAPFTPYLLKIASSTTESLAKKIADEGGEKAWEVAQSLWNYLENKLNKDGEIHDAARMLARKPEDETRQAMLIEIIATQLAYNPSAVQDLSRMLGGQESIQKIIATNESLIENVTQRMKSNGQQVIKASGKSTIRGVNQIQDE